MKLSDADIIVVGWGGVVPNDLQIRIYCDYEKGFEEGLKVKQQILENQEYREEFEHYATKQFLEEEFETVSITKKQFEQLKDNAEKFDLIKDESPTLNPNLLEENKQLKEKLADTKTDLLKYQVSFDCYKTQFEKITNRNESLREKRDNSKSQLIRALERFNLKRKKCVGCPNRYDFCKKHYKEWTRIMKKFGDEFD